VKRTLGQEGADGRDGAQALAVISNTKSRIAPTGSSPRAPRDAGWRSLRVQHGVDDMFERFRTSDGSW
jgi:hypothetical protein